MLDSYFLNPNFLITTIIILYPLYQSPLNQLITIIQLNLL